MISIKESSLYKSLKSEGVIFGPQAKAELAKIDTKGHGYLPLNKGDIIVFPSNITYDISKKYGRHILVHLLIGGNTECIEVFKLYGGTIIRTLYPVVINNEGEYIQSGSIVKNDGSLIDFVNNFDDINDAFDALQGKAAKIINVDWYEVFRYGSHDETQKKARYTIDFIDVSEELQDIAETKPIYT